MVMCDHCLAELSSEDAGLPNNIPFVFERFVGIWEGMTSLPRARDLCR